MNILKCSAIAGFCVATFIATQALGATSHLGQPISQHVTLTYVGDENTGCLNNPAAGIAKRSFKRAFPSGAISTEKFVVPSGKQLVVTDVQWTAPYFLTGTTPVVGQSAILKLVIHDPSHGNDMLVFQSTPVVITTQNKSAKLGSTESMTTGFRWGRPGLLCASISNISAGYDAGTLDPENIILNGYLIDQ